MLSHHSFYDKYTHRLNNTVFKVSSYWKKFMSSSLFKLYAILLLGMISVTFVVEAKFPNKTLVSPPVCTGKSTSKDYNSKVKHLIDSFVKDTKISKRNIYGDRQFNHSYPNRNPGSPSGVSTCYQDLGRLDCWNCLLAVKSTYKEECRHPIGATVILQDCSITFNVTV